MIVTAKSRYPGPAGMFACSLLCHAIVFLLLVKLQILPHAAQVEAPSYYVDLVTLPVANPQAGMPAAPAPAAVEASAPPEEPAAPVLPARPAAPIAKPKQQATPGKSAPAPADDGRDFNERLVKLAQQAEARREEQRYHEALAKLQKGGSVRVGIPAGKGTESGSDYASWVQSRLKDAFLSTIASDTTSPRVSVRLAIGTNGRISRYRIEQSTGDHVFEESVERAVKLAEKSFRPPPAGVEFEQRFVFRPQGVNVK